MPFKAKRTEAVPAELIYCVYGSAIELTGSEFITCPGFGGGSIFCADPYSLASALQSMFPYGAGVNYYGITANFWITLPQGVAAPIDWTVHTIGDPTPIPLIFGEVSCSNVLALPCYEVRFTVPDAAAYYAYFITTAYAPGEILPATLYNDPTLQAAFNLWCLTTLGPDASVTVTVVGNEVTIHIDNAPYMIQYIRSTDFVNPDQDENFVEVVC